MLTVGQDQTMTHLDLTMLFIKRILQINRNGSDMCDGVSCMNLIVSILENMIGKIDHKIPEIISYLAQELSFGGDKNHYKVMIL